MDHRDIQAGTNPWFDEFDESRMIATIYELEIDGEIRENISVFCKFDVCRTCEGKGTHVNPSIDSHGITAEEWDRDWSYEDRENYMTGFYDVECYECRGKRVVPVPSEYTNSPLIIKAIENIIQANLDYARECAMEREMGY